MNTFALLAFLLESLENGLEIMDILGHPIQNIVNARLFDTALIIRDKDEPIKN